MIGLAAGELDRTLEILAPGAVTDNGLERLAAAHAIVGKRPARRTDASDGERVRAAEQGQTLSTRFLVRADALTRQIDGTYQLRCDGELFEVLGTKQAWGKAGIEITATSRPDETEAAS